MDFFNIGVPVGTYWGINVRLHFTFFIFAFYRIQAYGHIGYGLAYVLGLYVCILLHEFGHALAARWCDGEAREILLWPLGGLAFVRPAFNATAHLITTVAGPFVTLVLWLGFWGATAGIEQWAPALILDGHPLYWFCASMRTLNGVLLVFNLLPAFPMDGGRILRDTIWHWTSAEFATGVAVAVSRLVAALAVLWAVNDYAQLIPLRPSPLGIMGTIIMALFILPQAAQEQQIVGFEGLGTYQFSIRERLARGRRQRAFYGAVKGRQKADAVAAFHRCAICGKTEHDDPHLDFRVCTDCKGEEEYCPEHLNSHQHT